MHHPRLTLAALAIAAFAGSAAAAPVGLTADAAALSAKQVQLAMPGAASGMYWFDFDGAGGNAAFMTYADLTTAGGGWMLGLHSLSGSEAPSTDMVANVGAASLSNGFTRDMRIWAIDQAAQIRHRITDITGRVLFDGYYTGRYHDALAAAADWTVLDGSFTSAGFDLGYHLGAAWTTTTQDRDTYAGNCAANVDGNPWYYRSCFSVIPTGLGSFNGPQTNTPLQLGSYDIYVRELSTPTLPPEPDRNVPEPGSLALAAAALTLAGTAGRRRRAP